MPKVSVIVPIWNVEKYLPKCLDSLINQTLKDIEIICINDGSPDNCLSILKEYQSRDNRIIVIDQKNGGLANARNSGLRVAKCEYIMFCDSDDYYDITMCEKMYDAIADNDCDLAVCEVNVIKEENTKNTYDPKNRYKLRYTGRQIYDTERILSSNVVAWNKIFKKSLINEYSINFPNNLLNEDESFFYKYSFVCKSVFSLNEILYYYLIRDDSIMDKINSGKINSYMSYILSMQDIFNFLKKNNLLKEKSELFFIVFFKLMNNQQKKLLNKKDIIKICNILNESVSSKDLDYNLLNRERRNIIELIKNKKYDKLLFILKSFTEHKYQTKYNLKLFDFISIFKIKEYSDKKNSIKKKFYIFSIPFLKIIKKDKKTYIKLFGFIPLLKIKNS